MLKRKTEKMDSSTIFEKLSYKIGDVLRKQAIVQHSILFAL